MCPVDDSAAVVPGIFAGEADGVTFAHGDALGQIDVVRDEDRAAAGSAIQADEKALMAIPSVSSGRVLMTVPPPVTATRSRRSRASAAKSESPVCGLETDGDDGDGAAPGRPGRFSR